MVLELAFHVGVILVATSALWLGSSWLEEASAQLAIHYNLPPVVQGGIIAALGSSFPELASVVISGALGVFDLGVGTVVGSAIFNILVIPGIVAVITDTEMKVNRTVVHKEALFYVIAVLVLFLTFAFAVVYNPLDGRVTGEMTRLLVLFPLGIYVLYLFMQWQDTTEYAGSSTSSSVNVLKQWGMLVGGLLVILVAVERLVDSVLFFGDLFGTSDFLWGVTIVAGATSLPDLLVSVQASARQHHVAGVANVLGSNIFDLLVVIPIGVLLVGTVPINFGIAAPLMVCLFAATLLLFVVLRTNLLLKSSEGGLLLLAYLVFLIWAGAEALGFLHLLPSA